MLDSRLIRYSQTALRPRSSAARAGSLDLLTPLAALLLEVPHLSWPPTPTTDFGELVFVALTMAISFSIMVVLGHWWSR